MLDVDFFARFLNLSPKEKILLNLYIKKVVTKEEIDHLLYDFDYNIEKENLNFNFLLSLLFQNNPHIEIPKNIEPRLKGVLRWFQYRNISLLSGLKLLIVELNKQNIPVLLIKGAAMKILEPDKARMMADVDCAVGVDNLNKTVKISKELGFKINESYKHATEVRKSDILKIDIHNKIVKSDTDTTITDKKIFERAKEYDFYGSKVLIPNTEDMIFLLLTNGYENILYSQPFYKNISWLLDVVYILKNNRNIDWNFVVVDAKETDTLAQVKIMFELINYFLPNTVPDNIISSIQISGQENKFFHAYTKKHLFFSKAQQLKEQVRDMVKGNEKFNFFLALKLTSRFFYLKIIQKTPVINSLFFDKVANRIFEI